VGRRALIVGSLLGPLTVGAGTARAAWQAGGSGTVKVPATALPAGAAPAATVSGQDVDLSWAAATMDSAVVSYQIRRYDASTGVQQPIGSACDTVTVDLSCREAGVPAGNWTYRVTPVYAAWAGAPSPDSATVTTPPPVPTGVSANAASSAAITISWDAASGATGYQVQRAEISGGPYTVIATPATNSYLDGGLTAGTAYYYVVMSTFDGAVSPASNEAGATTAAASDFANGDFETGSLSPWTSTPASSSSGASVESAFNGYEPHGGSSFAVVAPEGQDTYTHLAQSFTATAGQTVSGWAFFDGEDYLPYDDGAVVIQQDGSDLETVFAASIGALGNYGKTGWTAWSYTVPSSGTYTVDARVRNRGDGSVPSYLGLDDVIVQ
jgi:hypothetical protein